MSHLVPLLKFNHHSIYPIETLNIDHTVLQEVQRQHAQLVILGVALYLNRDWKTGKNLGGVNNSYRAAGALASALGRAVNEDGSACSYTANLGAR
jgi:hypothetical protein